MSTVIEKSKQINKVLAGCDWNAEEEGIVFD